MRAKEPADDYGCTEGQTSEEGDQCVDDRTGGTNGCKCLFSDKVSNDQTVYRIVKLLEDVSHKQRNGKCN